MTAPVLFVACVALVVCGIVLGRQMYGNQPELDALRAKHDRLHRAFHASAGLASELSVRALEAEARVAHLEEHGAEARLRQVLAGPPSPFGPMRLLQGGDPR